MAAIAISRILERASWQVTPCGFIRTKPPRPNGCNLSFWEESLPPLHAD